MNRIILGIATTLVLAGAVRAAEKREIRLDTHQFQFSPEVVIDPKDGTVRLARSVLFANEMGATDSRQTEALSAEVWAKKPLRVLLRDRSDLTGADLFVFGSPREIEFNRKVLPAERLASTGWSRVKVPVSLIITERELMDRIGSEATAD